MRRRGEKIEHDFDNIGIAQPRGGHPARRRANICDKMTIAIPSAIIGFFVSAGSYFFMNRTRDNMAENGYEEGIGEALLVDTTTHALGTGGGIVTGTHAGVRIGDALNVRRQDSMQSAITGAATGTWFGSGPWAEVVMSKLTGESKER